MKHGREEILADALIWAFNDIEQRTLEARADKAKSEFDAGYSMAFEHVLDMINSRLGVLQDTRSEDDDGDGDNPDDDIATENS